MDWYCPFQISGIGSDKIKVTHGIDSIQALLLAIQIIGTILVVHFQNSNPGKLTWLNQEQLGFPFFDSPETNPEKVKAPHPILKKGKSFRLNVRKEFLNADLRLTCEFFQIYV
ncbi:DUF6968 family protein [Leptospira gomenensis]|uniref:DUF6968 family protein n=1 Tax=Leptospira gomenensis TaxID=2484974 RepID=UPI003CCC80F3